MPHNTNTEVANFDARLHYLRQVMHELRATSEAIQLGQYKQALRYIENWQDSLAWLENDNDIQEERFDTIQHHHEQAQKCIHSRDQRTTNKYSETNTTATIRELNNQARHHLRQIKRELIKAMHEKEMLLPTTKHTNPANAMANEKYG